MGKYATHKRMYGIDVETFATRHADYMRLYTNYLSGRELV
jgi:hypothetical protein